tara:strand:+ start:456 stop:956 length:501 start_codon:yes stop_codon:yes gene_type:complete
MSEHRITPVFKALLTILTVILASGCGGEFSYKRGANMTDFQTTKDSCAEENAAENEVDKCLEKSGWIVVGFDKPLVKEQPKTTASSEENIAAVDEPAVTEPRDPLEKVHISSWWQVGAGPSKLMADGESCTSELGEAYKPEGNMSLVTYGFIQCMKDRGWFALQEK